MNTILKEKCSFHEMIVELDNGAYALLDNNEILFKQIPAEIEIGNIDNLKSVPLLVKDKMKDNANSVLYLNQYVKMDENNVITYYNFSGNDINRRDWVCIAEDNL